MKLAIKACAALLCAFMVWEVLLEMFVLRAPAIQTHPVLGRVFVAGAYVCGEEGFASTHVNSLGMRNAEITPHRPGEQRIFVLGDSYTAGTHVGDGYTFCDITRRELVRRFGSRVTLINGGQSGESPAYYIHLADFYKSVIAPDYVVVQLEQQDFTTEMLDSHDAFYVMRDHAGFHSVHNAVYPPLNPITRRFPRLSFITGSTSVRLILDWFKTLRRKDAPVDPDAFEREGLSPAARDALAWSIGELNRRYPNVVLVYLPTIDYDQPDQPAPEVETLLAGAAASARVPLINMREAFLRAFRSTHQPSTGFNNTAPGTGHINTLGHRLVAQQLINYYESMIPR